MQCISDSVLTAFRSKISLEYFDFVGGKDEFKAECGVAYTGTGNKYSSIAHQRASKANSALLKLCGQLEALEIQSCQRMINAESKQVLASSASARERLQSEASAQRAEVAAHMLSNNNTKEGIITFFKSNVSLDVRPEAINLKEALQYLIDHEDYDSTGFELYDFIAEDVNVQYDKIMKILFGGEGRGELEPTAR
jgi:hypothetical protein